MIASLRVFLLVLFSGVLLAVSAHAELDFDKAIKIGSGPKTVIEFTDPDCPFCRKASHYFDSRKDVTRYVFFYPLPRHPQAKDKARYILSQKDHAAAYHEIMSGSKDKEKSFISTAAGTKLQQEHVEIARKSKVSSTPTFMIYGRIIEGFDLKKIEEALGPK